MGSLTVKVLPFPTSLCTSMLPPLASTRFFDTAKPSPMPRALVVNSG